MTIRLNSKRLSCLPVAMTTQNVVCTLSTQNVVCTLSSFLFVTPSEVLVCSLHCYGKMDAY